MAGRNPRRRLAFVELCQRIDHSLEEAESLAASDDRGGFVGSLIQAVAELEAAVLDIEEVERRMRWMESRKRRLAAMAAKLQSKATGGLARRLALVEIGLSQGMLHSKRPRERSSKRDAF
jgi:hypothetical protein